MDYELKGEKLQQQEVILEHRFRVWSSGRSAHDYWVRLTPVSLVLSPLKDQDGNLPGICCICPPGCGRGCLPRGHGMELGSKDIVACRPAHQSGQERQFLTKRMQNSVSPDIVGYPVFMVIAYPLTGNDGKRCRHNLFFHHLSSNYPGGKKRDKGKNEDMEAYSEAGKVRDTWVHSILTTLFPVVDDNASPWASNPFGGRRLLVIVNPFAGTGSAKKMLHKEVVPTLKEAGLDYDVLLTERANHAREVIAAEPDIARRWRGVIIVSGDGVIHEVMNGIFDRPDWKQVFQSVPLGVVPGGSGNGLSRSLIHAQNEPFDGKGAVSSVMNVARGKIIPLDLFHMDTSGTDVVDGPVNELPHRIGFLHISWGIIADVDIESEKIRGLGALRFTIYGLLRIGKLKTYKGKLWYLPKSKCSTGPCIDQAKKRKEKETLKILEDLRDTNEKTVDDSSSSSNSSSHNSEEKNVDGSDEAFSGDDVSAERDVPEVTLQNMSYKQKIDKDEDDLPEFLPADYPEAMVTPNTFFPGGRGTSYGSMLTQGQLYFRSWNELQTQVMVQAPPPVMLVADQERPHPQVHHVPPRDELDSILPSLDKPLPLSSAWEDSSDGNSESADDIKKEGWVHEEGEYVNVTLLNHPFVDSTAMLSPESLPDDGLLYLLIIRKGTSKTTLLKFMLEMETGNHIHLPGVEIVAVTAFRLVPENNTGHLTVDGENIPVGPIQAEILPRAARIFVK